MYDAILEFYGPDAKRSSNFAAIYTRRTNVLKRFGLVETMFWEDFKVDGVKTIRSLLNLLKKLYGATLGASRPKRRVLVACRGNALFPILYMAKLFMRFELLVYIPYPYSASEHFTGNRGRYFIKKAIDVWIKNSNATKVVQTNAMFNQYRASFVSPNSIDVGFFSPSESVRTRVRNRLDIPEDQIVLILVARLAKVKNVMTVIQAVKGLQLSLLIVGQGEEEEPIRQFIQTNRVNATLLGYLRPEDLASIYRCSDFYVSASYSEGSSKTLLEAMSCAVYPILSDIPAHREVVADGAGKLVENTPRGFRDALHEVTHMDPSELDSLKYKCREKVMREYAADKCEKREQELLMKVLAHAE